MTSGAVLSPRARADINGIWDHTEQHWGAEQAERYVRQLWNDITYLAADPRRGQDCAHIRAGYQKFSSGSHVVFYRLIPGGIDIVRILHSRMDFGRHL